MLKKLGAYIVLTFLASACPRKETTPDPAPLDAVDATYEEMPRDLTADGGPYDAAQVDAALEND